MPPPADRQPATPLHARWVLLRHTLADGSWHHDWMLERARPAAQDDDPDEHRLLTFRTVAIPGQVSAWTGEKIHDHRARYLQYEGPLSGERGRVDRVAAGEFDWITLESSRLALRLRSGEGVIHGTDSGDLWRFTLDSDAKIW